jgi:hypothetical protein
MKTATTAASAKPSTTNVNVSIAGFVRAVTRTIAEKVRAA